MPGRVEKSARSICWRRSCWTGRIDKKGVAAEGAELPPGAVIGYRYQGKPETPGIVIKSKDTGIVIARLEDSLGQVVLFAPAAAGGKFTPGMYYSNYNGFSIGQFKDADLLRPGERFVFFKVTGQGTPLRPETRRCAAEKVV